MVYLSVVDPSITCYYVEKIYKKFLPLALQKNSFKKMIDELNLKIENGLKAY